MCVESTQVGKCAPKIIFSFHHSRDSGEIWGQHINTSSELVSPVPSFWNWFFLNKISYLYIMVSPENLANIMGKKYWYSLVSKEPNYYICFAHHTLQSSFYLITRGTRLCPVHSLHPLQSPSPSPLQHPNPRQTTNGLGYMDPGTTFLWPLTPGGRDTQSEHRK